MKLGRFRLSLENLFHLISLSNRNVAGLVEKRKNNHKVFFFDISFLCLNILSIKFKGSRLGYNVISLKKLSAIKLYLLLIIFIAI